MDRFGKRRSRISLAVPALLLGLLALSVLVLAACGGGGAASVTAPPATTPPAAGPSQTQTPGGTTSGTLPPPGGTSMAVSYAQPPSLSTNNPANVIPASVCGWIFRPRVDIVVTAIGIFDADQDGLAVSHRVGLFDPRTKSLLAGVKVGPRSTLDGAFRWEALGSSVVLRAGHPYLIGAETLGGTGDPEWSSEVIYAPHSPTGQWAGEIAFCGLRTNMGSGFVAKGFHAPTAAGSGGLFAWMSPNFKFRPMTATLPTSRVPSRELMGESHSYSGPPPLLVGSDGVYRWDAPGTASLAQTQAAARRYVAVLSSRRIPGAELYAANATWDFWPAGRQVQGAENIERAQRRLADMEDLRWSWSAPYHVLGAPGIAVCEGMFTGSSRSVDGVPAPAPYLLLLAVNGDKIAHQEVFTGSVREAVSFYGSPPGPGDTAQAAARVATALGRAFATRDRAALRSLFATDILFRDTTYRHGVRGRDAVLSRCATVTPAKSDTITNRPAIAGPGWAVVRWTGRRFNKNGFLPNGVDESRNGATVIEVRDGKVVRMTLYLEAGDGGGSIIQEP